MFSQDEYAALHNHAALLDRSRRGRLQLTGADRRDYLHGLLTNDILSLGPGQGCYAALLTPQARMISDMRVSELGDRILIDLPSATAETVLRRLADFVFSEDVEVADIGARVAQWGLYGPSAAGLLSDFLSSERAWDPAGVAVQEMALHANAKATFRGEPLWIVRSDDFGVAGFELFPGAPQHAELGDRLLQAGAAAVSSETADVVRIEAGVPAWGADMDETTIPLEAGIEDRAISLTKGCYVGQEIIIRVLHRGQGRVARRLVGLMGERDAPPMTRGDLLRAGDRRVGAVTSAARSPRLDRPVALGYVQRDYSEPGSALSVDARKGPAGVSVVRLPFTAPADE